MNEEIKNIVEPEKNFDELKRSFGSLDDKSVTHGLLTEKVFLYSIEGEDLVNIRIDQINTSHLKDAALFRIAKIYFEQKKDVENALKKANEITNNEERIRCLVHLAVSVLKTENDISLADSIIERINTENDKQNYLKYYKEIRDQIGK